MRSTVSAAAGEGKRVVHNTLLVHTLIDNCSSMTAVCTHSRQTLGSVIPHCVAQGRGGACSALQKKGRGMYATPPV